MGNCDTAGAFLSNFLNTRIFAYSFRTSATLFTRLLRTLCIIRHSFPTVSLSALWFFTSLMKIFQDRPLNMQGMLCDHGLKCMSPVTDWGCQTGWIIYFMVYQEGLFWGCSCRWYSCDVLWNSYHIAYHPFSADFPSVCKAVFDLLALSISYRSNRVKPWKFSVIWITDETVNLERTFSYQ